MGKVKNMAWDEATNFLGDVERKLMEGEITKETALNKLKNAKCDLGFEGIHNEDDAEEWIGMVLKEKENEVENLRNGGTI